MVVQFAFFREDRKKQKKDKILQMIEKNYQISKSYAVPNGENKIFGQKIFLDIQKCRENYTNARQIESVARFSPALRTATFAEYFHVQRTNYERLKSEVEDLKKRVYSKEQEDSHFI